MPTRKCVHGDAAPRYKGGTCKICKAADGRKRRQQAKEERAAFKNSCKRNKPGPAPVRSITDTPLVFASVGFTAGSQAHQNAVAAAKSVAEAFGRMVFYITDVPERGGTSYRFGQSGPGEVVERWERACRGASWVGQPWGVRHLYRPCPLEAERTAAKVIQQVVK